MDQLGQHGEEDRDRAEGEEQEPGTPRSGIPFSGTDGPPRPQIAPSAVRAATAEHDAMDAAAADPMGEAPVTESAASPAEEEPEPSEAAAEDADLASDEEPDAEALDADELDTDELDTDDEDVQAWRAVPLTTRLEALLFAAPAPLSARKLQKLAGDVDGAELRDALASLAAHYEASERAFVLEEIGGGYQLRTRSELSGLLARLGRKRTAEKLTPAALETLAIVAYRQPVLRSDVEKIRGVASGEVLRTLVEKGMVRVAGRADLPGSPLLYGTTPAFLELFGLRDLKDLPTDRELLR